MPWRTERRQMYDRVVDVPRLVSFHDLSDERSPASALTQLRRRLNDIYAGELGEPFTTAGLCCTATAPTASPGTATPSVAAAPRTPWWRSSASAPPASSRCALAAAAHRCDFRSAHGDLLVMGGSCQRTWEHAVPKTSAHGPADQHPVPPARRALDDCRAADRGDPLTSRSRARCVSTGFTG